MNEFVISPDNPVATSAGEDVMVQVRSINEAGEHHRFEGYSGPVNAVVFTPDRRYALSAGEDGTVRVWRMEITK